MILPSGNVPNLCTPYCYAFERFLLSYISCIGYCLAIFLYLWNFPSWKNLDRYNAPDATNASDDDDDDFMPPNPSRHLPNVKTVRPNVPTTPATGDAGPSRGRAPSRHPPDETPSWDDDDDFMPMPPPWPAPSPVNPEDEATWSPTLPRPLPPLRLPPFNPPHGSSSFYLYRHTEWP